MVSRLMISLKKAAKAGENGWTSNALSRTHVRTVTEIAFRPPPTGLEGSSGAVSEEVVLADLSDERVRRRSGLRTV